MNISKIDYKKNPQSFRGINVSKADYTKFITINVEAADVAQDAAVKFLDKRVHALYDLGVSENAKKTVELLRKLGKDVLEDKNIAKVRRLLNKALGKDIELELNKEQVIQGRTFTMLNGIGKYDLANIRRAAKKGTPSYFTKKGNGPIVLSFVYKPQEKPSI